MLECSRFKLAKEKNCSTFVIKMFKEETLLDGGLREGV